MHILNIDLPNRSEHPCSMWHKLTEEKIVFLKKKKNSNMYSVHINLQKIGYLKKYNLFH